MRLAFSSLSCEWENWGSARKSYLAQGHGVESRGVWIWNQVHLAPKPALIESAVKHMHGNSSFLPQIHPTNGHLGGSKTRWLDGGCFCFSNYSSPPRPQLQCTQYLLFPDKSWEFWLKQFLFSGMFLPSIPSYFLFPAAFMQPRLSE